MKPGTFRLDARSNNYYFTITNFKQEVDVVFRAAVGAMFKEGDNVVLTAYLPNRDNQHKIIATNVMPNHSMETENWKGNNLAPRNNNIILN